MKKLIIPFLFILLILSLNCENSDEQPVIQSTLLTCLPANLQSDLIAFYPFNNGSLNDESGNNNNLLNNTSANSTTDRNGNINCAFNFNSSNNEFLEYNNPTFLDDLPQNNFSISFWYKANNDIGYSQFIHRNGVQNYGQWYVEFVDEFFAFGANGANGSGHHISFLDWEHIVLTVSGTNLNFYKNGVLESQQSNQSSTNPTVNQGDLFIGKSLDGQMDDIIIYDKELNPMEISGLFNMSPCCN